MRDIKTQMETSQHNEATLKEYNNVLASNFKEIKRWFKNMSSLLNYSQAADALSKNKQYAITDGDVLTAINDFTVKLQARLNKHKNEEVMLIQ
jgi:ribosome-associated translation inhibitor RaiA